MLASEVLILCSIRNRGLEWMDDSSYRRNFEQDKKNETITIQFYSCYDAHSSCGVGFHSSCFDQHFVYSWNHPLGKSETSSLNFYFLLHFSRRAVIWRLSSLYKWAHILHVFPPPTFISGGPKAPPVPPPLIMVIADEKNFSKTIFPTYPPNFLRIWNQNHSLFFFADFGVRISWLKYWRVLP
jgi:hypothetical protein